MPQQCSPPRSAPLTLPQPRLRVVADMLLFILPTDRGGSQACACKILCKSVKMYNRNAAHLPHHRVALGRSLRTVNQRLLVFIIVIDLPFCLRSAHAADIAVYLSASSYSVRGPSALLLLLLLPRRCLRSCDGENVA